VCPPGGESISDGVAAAVDSTDERAQAFRRLAEQHLDASYGLAYAILRDVVEAQDATHDAFVAAWRAWATLRDPDRFQAWFDRILVYTCRHRLRDQARRRSRHGVRDVSAELGPVVTDHQARVVERDHIARGLSGLTADQRIVLALRYERDLTVDQIARHLGIRAGTVKSRLHHALRRLRDRLETIDREGAADG